MMFLNSKKVASKSFQTGTYCHAIKLIIAVIVMTFTALTPWMQAGENAPEKPVSGFNRQQEAILDAFFHMEQSEVTGRDRSALENLSRDRKYSFYAKPLLVRLEREEKKDAAKALKVVASILYTKKENNENFENDLKSFQEYLEISKANPGMVSPVLRMPDPQDFNLNYAWCAVEASRCLLSLGQYTDALNLVNAVGQKDTSFPRVMAADAAGDIFASQRKWDDACKWYSSALQFHAAWKKGAAQKPEEKEDGEKDKKDKKDTKDTFGDKGDNESGPSVWSFIEGTILTNIKLKLAEARRLAEMEASGPGYYLYREAQQAYSQRDFRYAIVIYDEIIASFEETVYGDAAKCYRIKSLLALAEIDPVELAKVEDRRMNALLESVSTRYDELKYPEIKTDEKAQKAAKKRRIEAIENDDKRVPWWPQKGDAKMMAQELVRLVNGDGKEAAPEDKQLPDEESDLSENTNTNTSSENESKNEEMSKKDKEKEFFTKPVEVEGKLVYEYDMFAETPAQKGLRRSSLVEEIPLGKKAFKEAVEQCDAFVADQKFGLYRGESMMDVAVYVLEEKLDLDDAVTRLRAATKWFQDVKEFDATIATFVLNEHVRKASAPPMALKKKDMWGNISWVGGNPSQIENRRTSTRYLPYQHMMAQTRLAFCLFVDGKKEEAIPLLDIILESDPTEREFQKTGWPNSYARFKAEFEADCLFATKEDLKHFKGKAKLAIMIADYYYELEQWGEAAKRYRRFAKEFGEKLDTTAEAYITLMLGFSESTMRSRDKALSYFQKFEGEEGKKYRKTPSWSRAMFVLFTFYQNKPETRPKAIKCLDDVRKYSNSDKDKQEAHLFQGIMCYSFGDFKEARKIFQDCIKKYKGTHAGRAASNFMKSIEKKEAEMEVEDKSKESNRSTS